MWMSKKLPEPTGWDCTKERMFRLGFIGDPSGRPKRSFPQKSADLALCGCRRSCQSRRVGTAPRSVCSTLALSRALNVASHKNPHPSGRPKRSFPQKSADLALCGCRRSCQGQRVGTAPRSVVPPWLYLVALNVASHKNPQTCAMWMSCQGQRVGTAPRSVCSALALSATRVVALNVASHKNPQT